MTSQHFDSGCGRDEHDYQIDSLSISAKPSQCAQDDKACPNSCESYLVCFVPNVQRNYQEITRPVPSIFVMNTKRPPKPKKPSNPDKGGASYIDRRQSSVYANVALAHRRKSDAQPGSYRNAAQLTGRESLLPLAIVITLFVLWGFTSGLGEVPNKKFQSVLHLSKARSTGLQVAFYG